MIWHLYFISKLFLAAQDRLHLDGWLNFPLALFVYWPLTHRRWRLARAVLAWPVAVALAAHEAGANLNPHLLPFSELATQSPSDVLESCLHLLADNALPALAAVLLLGLWINRWLRLDVLLSLALLAFPLASSKHRPVEAPPFPLESTQAGLSINPQMRGQDVPSSRTCGLVFAANKVESLVSLGTPHEAAQGHSPLAPRQTTCEQPTSH